jgi:Thioredoxin
VILVVPATAAGLVLAAGAVFAVGAGEAVVVARRRRRDRRETGYLAAMNPLPRELWSRRLSFQGYLATASHNRETFEEVYREPSHRESDLAWMRGLPPLRVVAIGEDWCPDVAHTLPTWARIVEALPGWELGVYARDAVPELMDTFLWLGDRRRIPVYAFYLGTSLQVWWSGRGSAAEQALAALLAGRAFNDLPPGERQRCGRLLQEGYRREYRRQSLEEILTLLRAFFHLPAA